MSQEARSAVSSHDEVGLARKPRSAVSDRVVTFQQAVQVCFATPELMTEYRRLTGSSLGLDDRSGIARLIDDAVGRDPWESEYAPFFRFVRDFVWLPLLAAEAAA